MISLLLTLTVPYVATAGIMPLIGMSLFNITNMFYDSLEPKYKLSSIDFLGRCFLQVLMETYYQQSILFIPTDTNPASIFLFQVNNGSTRAMFEISSRLTIKTPEGRQ